MIGTQNLVNEVPIQTAISPLFLYNNDIGKSM